MKKIHENKTLRVEENNSGELFITNIRSGATFRIRDIRNDLVVSTNRTMYRAESRDHLLVITEVK